MVFVGVDNEEYPTCGGIHLAELVPNLKLQVLVSLGETLVPNPINEPLTRVGEALSFDGRLLAFWGACGDEEKTVFFVPLLAIMILEIIALH
jgi:hypothetical protein